jgi:hypothetical protein
MTEEKVVPVEEVQRITKYVDDILKKSISLPSSEKISVRPEKSDLDEKEKTILDYIKNNPGDIKQTVVDAFKIKVGYSRKPVLKIVNKLERYGLIIVRPDKENIRKHHLFINNENALVLLIEIIDSFKQNYFTIIDGVEMLDDNKISNMAFIERSKLIESIILPFKSFTLLMQYNLFGQSETPSNKLILDKKFGIFHTAMQEIYLKLYQSKILKILTDDNEGQILIHLFSNNANGLRPENIIEMLKTFELYGLRENIEKLMDPLWKLSYPILPFVHSHYRRYNTKELKDWRRVIAEFDYLPYNPRTIYCPPIN